MVRLPHLVAAHVLIDGIIVADVDHVLVPDRGRLTVPEGELDEKVRRRVLDEVHLRRVDRVKRRVVPSLGSRLRIRPDVIGRDHERVVVQKQKPARFLEELAGRHERVGIRQDVLHRASLHRHGVALHVPHVARVQFLHLVNDALQSLLHHVAGVDVRSKLRIYG